MELDYLFVNQKIELLQGEHSALLKDKNKTFFFARIHVFDIRETRPEHHSRLTFQANGTTYKFISHISNFFYTMINMSCIATHKLTI